MLFNELNFSKDTNYAREVVEQNTKITNEMQQQAKILSHQLQRDLLCAIGNQVAENKQKKIEIEQRVYLMLYQINAEVEAKLGKEAGIVNGDIVIIPIMAFKKPTKPELTAFWNIRHPVGSKKTRKGKQRKA